MVDATIEVPGISDKDKLLTLTSSEALQHRVSDATVDHYDAALESMGLKVSCASGAEGWGEQLARIHRPCGFVIVDDLRIFRPTLRTLHSGLWGEWGDWG